MTFSCYVDSVCYQQANYGEAIAVGRAIPFRRASDGTYIYCANKTNAALNGNCNSTDKRASGGDIYLNSYYKTFMDNNSRFIVKHELAHMFGMAHAECEDSIMRLSYCGGLPSSLRPHDINHINANY